MSTEPKPMDPKRLEDLRRVAVPGNYAEFEVEIIIELLADRFGRPAHDILEEMAAL